MIADMSLYHLAYIAASCAYTVEPTRADYGYDLSIFTFDAEGRYENGNMFVQLKATDKIRIDPITRVVKFRISKRDILTWEDEPFPVYLVVFDAVQGKAYSIYLQRYLAVTGISSAMMTGGSIDILLADDVVGMDTIRGWRADKNDILMRMGTMKHD